MSPSIIGY